MEKLIYAFWRKPSGSKLADQLTELRRTVIEDLKPQLLSLGVERLQLNIADFADLSKALVNFQMQATQPQPDGIISFWLSSAYRRAPAEALLARAFGRIAGYSVLESAILPNTEHPSKEDTRSWGFTQVTFLQLPPRLTYEQWRHIWFHDHSRVGVETQSNYRYVQNVVVMPLTEGAPPWRGIIEESFPSEALTDPYVFYDAVGDEDKYQKNLTEMMESVARFIDFDQVDVLATGEYMLHSQPDPKL